ncbi:hypothetical protein TNCT_277701 [Trichonephila clavata]|uniref:Uncharacterized protein n=1 Tax=Trichonephila clavata TaxID=2740835 RepID=A0A8X6KII9_TRICU|nr:hypothetical protein TNCT_277701 [Trichonephila clavata]
MFRLLTGFHKLMFSKDFFLDFRIIYEIFRNGILEMNHLKGSQKNSYLRRLSQLFGVRKRNRCNSLSF